MLFKSQAERDFDIEIPDMVEMDALISTCSDIYAGVPYWLSREDGIRTVNFAKAICSEVARLVTMGIKIQVDGSPRAEWLQGQIDKAFFRIRDWVEYGCAYGTVFIKPGTDGLDLITPMDVLITEYDNLGIKGIIFRDTYAQGNKYYTRLEYHRFMDVEQDGKLYSPYYVSNRAYVSQRADDIGKSIPLSETKWTGMMEDTPPILKENGERIDGPMYGVFRTPQANNVDINSPLGMPVFAEAIEELRDLDVAYSRNAGEIFDSEKIILADDRLLMPDGVSMAKRTVSGMSGRVEEMKLPHYVKNVFGTDAKEFYTEINPQLNTETRLSGLNNLLSQIGYKIGFSNGYFVFNKSGGIQTATGVEADQQRTVQFVKDVRDKLEACMDGVIYALDTYANVTRLNPAGQYEVVYDFGDILYVREDDKAKWWQYVLTGKVPFWYYLVKFEGFTEEEAKALEEAAKPKETGLFEEE